jgi:membrane protease YdiL (CAAX protease family)
MMTMRYTLFLLLTGAVTAFLGYGTWATARLLREWTPPRNPLLEPLEAFAKLALSGLCIFLGWLSGVPPAALGWTAERAAALAAWGILAGAGLGLLFHAASRWVVARSGTRYYSPALVELIAPRSAAELGWIALAMIPAVLLEELLFRSLLVGGLGPLAPLPLLVVASALLFGLMHSPQGAWGMAGATAAGVLFGALFLASGSLVLPLAAHYVTNLVQLAIALREKGKGESTR